MKIFVYRNKKNYGPYSLDILREFLKKSLLSESDLFCYDKKNWVKLSEVPGMTTANPKEKLDGVQLKKEHKTKTDPMLQAEKPLSLDYIASCILQKPKYVFDILSKRGFVVQNNKIDRHIGIKLIDEFIAKAKSASKDEKTFSLPKSNSDILEDYNKYPHDSVLDDSYYNNEEEIRIALDCGGSISHTDGSSFGSSGIEDLP